MKLSSILFLLVLIANCVNGLSIKNKFIFKLKHHNNFYNFIGQIVCFFQNDAYYRVGKGIYLINDIDVNRCTHIIYSSILVNRRGALFLKNYSADIDGGCKVKYFIIAHLVNTTLIIDRRIKKNCETKRAQPKCEDINLHWRLFTGFISLSNNS